MLVERHEDLVFCDRDGGGNIQEVAEDFLGLSAFVFARDFLGHESIEGTSHQRDLQIEIDLQPDHRREGIDVKELDGLGDAVLDEHALA